jgi:hypothetical protein
VYQAMRAAAPDAAACDRCHAPLAAVLGRADPLAAEGVTCEVCHSIAAVELADEPGAAAGWTLQLAGNRKYGPLCDVEEPYFHRAGCSPLHAASRLCAACHHLTQPGAAGVALPVFSEFAEWQHGEAMSAGLQCQGCHMPKSGGTVASGGPRRVGVSQHGDVVAAGDALKVEAAVLARAGGLEVAGRVRVSGVAHGLPAGVPGRELALVCELVDGTGRILASDEVTYGRVLVDDGGREVPFFAARRVGADTRLHPGDARAFTLRLPAPPEGGAVVLRLLDRPISPSLARALAIAPPAARELSQRRFTGPWQAAP